MRFTARVFALTALALFLALLLAPSVAALEETAQEAELEETVLEPTILDDSHHYVSAYDQAIANVDAEIAKHNHTEEGAAPEYERTTVEEAVYDWASYPVSWQALFTFFVLVALVPVVYVTCASRKVAAPEAKEGAEYGAAAV